ncbi:hypothetical protein [Levilactobacillus parabrevis]|nr:hypothetical protein [Levilactobacillus parabrevis]
MERENIPVDPRLVAEVGAVLKGQLTQLELIQLLYSDYKVNKSK